MQVKPSTQPVIVVLPLCHTDDTESARASRKQYKETIYSVLFDMNVPAVCAVDQVCINKFFDYQLHQMDTFFKFHLVFSI